LHFGRIAVALFLTEHEVEQLLTVQDSIDILEASIREQGQKLATNRPRQIVNTPGAMLSVLPAAIPSLGSLGFKTYTVSKEGVRFWILLFKEDGELHCLMEADHIGLVRTGGASGVATKYMSRKDSKVAGILGTGFQAHSQLEGVCSVRQIEKVLAYSRTRDNLLSFCKGMSNRLGIPVEPTESAEQVVRNVDVLSTITSSAEPVVDGSWLSEGVHMNLAGAMKPSSREVDTDTLVRCDLITVDDWQQSHIESGEFIKAVGEGKLKWDSIRELSDVVAEAAPRERSAITLFKSHGIGLWDIAMASLVYKRARDHGLGKELALTQRPNVLRRGLNPQVLAWAEG
jgi:alanine dehydrogenase